ncbi:MAG: dTMP kinase [Thermoplasmata archaeon M9B1D]|nr:MAG: dTMP kinase [Thermoplasmata archaeon M9B1D]PNX51644.1 MAG: dTMP kinase [Thermoplasmata archaeon M8B2D]
MKHFVTFEGIDGSGKSTIIKTVFETLKSNDYDVVLTFEPTNSWIGKIVQKCIKTKSDPFVTAFTFIADRADHCKKIQKWLDSGKIVLCDRYAESTYAYQGAQMEDLVDDPIKWLQDLSKNRIIIPERTFLFVITPSDSVARIQNRDNLIPFEKVDFLEKVHKNYLNICKGKRFIKLNATKTIQELTDICYDDIIK